MSHTTSLKQVACEALFHFYPVRTLARELGVSPSTVGSWKTFVEHGDYAWVNEPYTTHRHAQLEKAVHYWIDTYPVTYSGVARKFGVRTSELYIRLQKVFDSTFTAHLPAKLRLWNSFEMPTRRENGMDIKQYENMLAKCKTQKQKDKLFHDILVCYEALFQEVTKDCSDSLKKKELSQYQTFLKEALEYHKRAAFSESTERRTTTPSRKATKR